MKMSMSWGLTDVFRKHHPDEPGQYTFFDYRVRDSVGRNLGWRVDHILATKTLAAKSGECTIDLATRLAEKPSDHAVIYARWEGKNLMGNEEDLKRINEIIAARFNKIEDGFMSAETIAGLFENLLDGIEKEFSVPFVWLTLIDHEKAAPVIDEIKSSDILKSRFSVVSQELFEKIMPGGMKPVLANKDLQPFYKLLPPSRKYFVRSIAVVPFTIDGQIIGTWNNGDADANRYEPDMKTDLIEALAAQISRKLSQLVADKNAVSGSERQQSNPPGGPS